MSDNKKNKKKLKQLVDTLKTKQAEIAAFEEKHAGVFEKKRQMAEDLEGIAERVKLLARDMVEAGETVTLHSDKQLLLTVQAPKKPVIYDFEAAQEKWHDDELNEYRSDSLDAEKILKALANEELSPKDLDGIQKYGEAGTPRVSIKWL